MHVAAKHGHMGVVSVLLDRGADSFAIDKRQFRAIDWAALRGHATLLRMMETRTCPFAWEVQLHSEGFFNDAWKSVWLCIHRARPFDNPAMPRNAVIACLYESADKTFPLYRLGQPTLHALTATDHTVSVVSFEIISSSAAKRGGAPKERRLTCRAPQDVYVWLMNVLSDGFASGRSSDYHAWMPLAARRVAARASTDAITNDPELASRLRALPRAITAAQAAALERANAEPGGDKKNHGYHYWQAPGPLPTPEGVLPGSPAAAGTALAARTRPSPVPSTSAAATAAPSTPAGLVDPALAAVLSPAELAQQAALMEHYSQQRRASGGGAAVTSAPQQRNNTPRVPTPLPPVAQQHRTHAQVRADQQLMLAAIGHPVLEPHQQHHHHQPSHQQPAAQTRRGGASTAPAPAPVPASASYVNKDAERLEDLDFDLDPPSDYLCPITMELMTDPVVAGDGHTYSRSGITRWLQNHRTSPKTNEILSDARVVPNHLLRGQILGWIDDHRMDKKEAAKAKAAASKPASVEVSPSIGLPTAAAVPVVLLEAPPGILVTSSSISSSAQPSPLPSAPPAVDPVAVVSTGPTVALPPVVSSSTVARRSSLTGSAANSSASVPAPPGRRSSAGGSAASEGNGTSNSSSSASATLSSVLPPSSVPIIGAPVNLSSGSSNGIAQAQPAAPSATAVAADLGRLFPSAPQHKPVVVPLQPQPPVRVSSGSDEAPVAAALERESVPG